MDLRKKKNNITPICDTKDSRFSQTLDEVHDIKKAICLFPSEDVNIEVNMGFGGGEPLMVAL